nr:EOG090X0LZH [Lepidurus arcticus]
MQGYVVMHPAVIAGLKDGQFQAAHVQEQRLCYSCAVYWNNNKYKICLDLRCETVDDNSLMVPPTANPSDVKNEENYKKKYQALKNKLKFLIYENEAFTEEINRTEQLILQVLRDKNYLLDQLLQYEEPETEASSLDGEATDSSDGETKPKPGMNKMKSKTSKPGTVGVKRLGVQSNAKPKKKAAKSPKSQEATSQDTSAAPSKQLDVAGMSSSSQNQHLQGHMTPEEVEKHLESRKLILDFAFDRAPPTVPVEMFSNELSSLDRYID